MANLSAIKGKFQLFLWEHISQYINALTNYRKNLAMVIQVEGIDLGKQQINAVCHVVDFSSRLIASPVVLCHHFWLCCTSLSSNTKS